MEKKQSFKLTSLYVLFIISSSTVVLVLICFYCLPIQTYDFLNTTKNANIRNICDFVFNTVLKTARIDFIHAELIMIFIITAILLIAGVVKLFVGRKLAKFLSIVTSVVAFLFILVLISFMSNLNNLLVRDYIIFDPNKYLENAGIGLNMAIFFASICFNFSIAEIAVNEKVKVKAR